VIFGAIFFLRQFWSRLNTLLVDGRYTLCGDDRHREQLVSPENDGGGIFYFYTVNSCLDASICLPAVSRIKDLISSSTV